MIHIVMSKFEVVHHTVVTTPKASGDHQTLLLPVRLFDFFPLSRFFHNLMTSPPNPNNLGSRTSIRKLFTK